MSRGISRNDSTLGPPPPEDKCEDPRCSRAPGQRVWFCGYCKRHYCTDCWNYQAPHQPKGRLGEDPRLHEKTDSRVTKRLIEILNPSSQTIEQDFEGEDESLWFGWSRDSGRPVLEDDSKAYLALMGNCPNLQFPQLVSFIGETGAGKSTLIKMLLNDSDDPSSPSPVVGSVVKDHTPTSADVHLYADSRTNETQKPILYADCEGLNGGEEDPIAVRHRKRLKKDKNETMHVIRRATSRVRHLDWATTDQKATRQFAVGELYPRLLYTFSDVVVFVVRNAKTFSNVCQKLIEWASRSLEMSINQPALPHIIVVVNATHLGVDESEWDVDTATSNLLASVRNALRKHHAIPYFLYLAEEWKRRGKHISSILELIQCYYATFTVVRIPVAGRYRLLNDQVDKLYETIKWCCQLAHDAKRTARLLLPSDVFNVYMQAAFDHFCLHLDVPFNFLSVSLRTKPIPSDFGDHILQLASTVSRQLERKPQTNQGAQTVFKHLSGMLASCVMLDVVRSDYGGWPMDVIAKYEPSFTAVLQEFYNKSWPCQFRSARGMNCVNFKASHSPKGHQNERGRIFAVGGYEPGDFSAPEYNDQWVAMVKTHLKAYQDELRDKTSLSDDPQADLQMVAKLHIKNMATFFHKVGGAKNLMSNITCFCCLMAVPEHCLPCGHVLCNRCIESYSTKQNTQSSVRVIDYCPLHETETKQDTPFLIRLKPEFAGVRILSLDGGGIRGIVELEILNAIQYYIGIGIPIQNCFDIICGTSTGGLIALGLGVKAWSVEECIRRFLDLCDTAFTSRILGKAALLNHNSIFKTSSLHEALKSSFGDDKLFGGKFGKYSREHHHIKVAVTSTDVSAQKAIILANYNRHGNILPDYQFRRPADPSHELTIWEAAAATTAAPPFFKAFQHKIYSLNTTSAQIDGTYYDEAIFHNNPVKAAHRERKFLWPESANQHPDILLSIGTGQDHNLKRKLDEELRNFGQYGIDDGVQTTKRAGTNILSRFYHFAKNHVQTILDAERIWHGFLADLVGSAHNDPNHARYIRINPTFDNVPALDAKGRILEIQQRTKEELRHERMKNTVTEVGRRLIASLFYFEPRPSHKSDGGHQHYTCSGKICCRFENGSDYLSHLGEFLQQQQRPSFQPYFEIVVIGDSYKKQIPLSEEMIHRVRFRRELDLGSIEIDASARSSPVDIKLYFPPAGRAWNSYSISGFPRAVMEENALKVTLSSPVSETLPSPDPTNKNKQDPNLSYNFGEEEGRAWDDGDKSNLSPNRSPEVSPAHNRTAGWSEFIKRRSDSRSSPSSTSSTTRRPPPNHLPTRSRSGRSVQHSPAPSRSPARSAHEEDALVIELNGWLSEEEQLRIATERSLRQR